jgi:hypothetical protein
MSRLQLKEVFRANEFLSLTFSRILLIVMMTCFGIALIQVIQGFVPAWDGSFLAWLCLITSLEAVVVQNRLRKASELEHSKTFYRVMEWVVILIVLKVVLYFRVGWGTLLDDIPNWSRDFLGSFFNTNYFLSVFVLMAVWGFTFWFVTDLEEIENDVALVDASDAGGFYSNRSAVRGRLTNRFLTIGFIIVFMTALFTLDFDALFKGSVIFHHRSGALNLIIYFLAGMLLLSQTQFSVLRAGWAWERIPIQPHIARHWITYSLVALVLVTGIAFILPTSYSMGLLATLGYIFSLLFSLLTGLILLLLSPFIILIGWLLRLLGKNGPIVSMPEMKLPTPPPETVGRVHHSWMDVAQSVLFWAIFIGVIGYALYQYFKQNKALLQKIKQARGIKFLVQAWDWIRGRLRGFNLAVTAAVGARVQRLRAFITRSLPQETWNYINLRRLSPRQRVLFFYLALIRRGGEYGLSRKPSQTPYEYARFLDKSLPEVSESVDSMTESFMEARYSNHTVEVDQAASVQSYWERIRRALQELRNHSKAK